MQSFVQRCSWFCLLILLSGCAQKELVQKEPPKIPVMSEVAPKPTYKAPGSLYTGYDNLFSDAKAHNIGDIVTILVNENLQGTGTTDTKSQRSNNLNLSFPSVTVLDKKLPHNKSTIFGINQKSTNAFQGKGGTNRSAKLIAKITARVVKVYPNGNLFIVGTKYVKINNDTQYIKISGIVKPQDINPDNSIDSSKIADMYVEYNGKGFLNTTQRPGWLANFIMKIWPF
ncbi:flagellar basal body L-ring protein FlgH [Nitratiruptor tergarcus]|uniref:Flagellar L-ring protein n=1 Tax=Nitratiruptor tergarcus DSM 16512 TaxID=1069081 RepID=A0A1W1WSH6_9BACT|nr:flagellar basal body L-ring protein FlgH [Nitratiruptor tergarcus]SMC09278.1 flagellar L-ring protein precursor FlgH [Nitratiruptor tergarcus DSM 16512]